MNVPFKRYNLFLFFLPAICMLSGCLPDNSANRYNQINHQAHIENTGTSLMHAAHQLNGWQVGQGMRRKSPLDPKSPLTNEATVNTGPAPVAPAGMTVAPCGPYSVVAYYNATPKGVGKLAASGPLMMSALSKRYGGRHVGLQMPGGSILPAVASDLACGVGPDIAVGSPIVMVGFAYGAQLLPDAHKATSPIITRDITIPCPTGTSGVIKREQQCTLVIDDHETEAEEGKVRVGGGHIGDGPDAGMMNDLVRLKRTWQCAPDLTALPAPTPDEVTRFCRDPANDLVKQPDNTIQMSWDSLQHQLEQTGPGAYTFQCRNDGTNNCVATPYTPPPKTTLSCAPVATPPLYVINPLFPLELDGNGNIVGMPDATRDCGRGWTGKLHARYMVRRCNLLKDGQVIGSKQTIYHIANAAALCSKELNDIKQACPFPYSGNMLVRKRFDMTRPLALDWNEYVPGGTYTPSNRIAWTGSRAEVLQSAQTQGYYVARNNFQSVPDSDFDTRLTSEMKDFIDSTITGCSLVGAEKCISPPDPIKLMILVDSSTSMDGDGGSSSVSYKQCQASGRDLFKPEYADLACGAIDNYHNYMGGPAGEHNPDDPSIERFEAGGIYQQEAALRQLLLESYLSPDLYERFSDFLISNPLGCHSLQNDTYGYCLSQVQENDQGTCPGSCITTNPSVTGTKRRITDAQMPALLSYIPSGSQVRYVEFGKDDATAEATFCNQLTDDTCNFATELLDFRTRINNTNNGDRTATNLITTLSNNMGFFGGDKGILMIVSDGEETDSCARKSDYQGFCSTPALSQCYPDYPRCQAAKIVGIPSATDALNSLSQTYSQTCLNLNSSDTEAVKTCDAVGEFLITSSPPSYTLKGNEWEKCRDIDASPKPRMIDWLAANYPQVEVVVFQFSKGGRGTLGCPIKYDLGDPLRFTSGLQEIFERIQPLKPNPRDICTRLGNGIPVY